MFGGIFYVCFLDFCHSTPSESLDVGISGGRWSDNFLLLNSYANAACQDGKKNKNNKKKFKEHMRYYFKCDYNKEKGRLVIFSHEPICKSRNITWGWDTIQFSILR